MRLHLKTTPNKSPVPFNYQQKLVGTIHKWLGNNSIHGAISLYSFSWLKGGRKEGDALRFANGASMFISFFDDNYIRKITRSILDDPEMFCGLVVTSITIEDSPMIDDRELFFCASPIFIKRNHTNATINHYTFTDPQANQFLKETLLSKMKIAGLEDDTLDIRFDTSYSKKKLKLVHYHGIGNKASICPIIIKGKPATKLFAWNVGVGNSTGIGFGAIY